ncbi:MAG: outer membrane lipid asymmetry maintenance protein MlaD [Desulfatiglandaceae bacterium]|jgi:phospholipid/cholesterol/gamma-HCH transport system substrate-binding protein
MKKRSIETTVGIFVLIGLLGVAYMTVKLGKLEVLGGKHYVLKARFGSVSGLKPGTEVRMLGIQIGRVEGFTLDQNNLVVMVRMKIRSNIKIYDDAIASIKTAGLIGDRYVTIDPGGSGALLKPGGVITQTEPPVDIEELISKYVFGSVGDKKK